MSKLSFFGLKNFKAFEGEHRFNFRKITFLVGKNSSGKSSLIHALKIVQNPPNNINSKDLGEPSDWLNDNAKEKNPSDINVSFSFPVLFEDENFNAIFYNYRSYYNLSTEVKKITEDINGYPLTPHEIKQQEQYRNSSIYNSVTDTENGEINRIFFEEKINQLKNNINKRNELIDQLETLHQIDINYKEYELYLEELRKLYNFKKQLFYLKAHSKKDEYLSFLYNKNYFAGINELVDFTGTTISKILKYNNYDIPEEFDSKFRFELTFGSSGNEMYKINSFEEAESNIYLVVENLLKNKDNLINLTGIQIDNFPVKLTQISQIRTLFNEIQKRKVNFTNDKVWWDLCTSCNNYNPPYYFTQKLDVEKLKKYYYNYNYGLLNYDECDPPGLDIQYFDEPEEFIKFYPYKDYLFIQKSNSNEVLQNIFYKVKSITKDIHRGFITKYLKLFNIGDDFKIQEYNIAGNLHYNFVLIKDGKELDLLKYCGYGVQTIIPLILSVVYTEAKIICVEEPEANLHPALQSKLADFFAECTTLFDVQFVIETHSEYLTRRMQFLITNNYNRKDNNSLPKIAIEDTNIYYFNDPKELTFGQEHAYEINFKRTGQLTRSFGKGFYDVVDDIALESFLINNQNEN